MPGILRLRKHLQRNRDKVLWIINLVLAVWLAYRLLNFPKGTKLLNWYILDELPPGTRQVYDGWANVTVRENLLPGVGPATVHYVWCDASPFVYNNFLSILSVFKVAKADKIILHMSSSSKNLLSAGTSLLDDLMYLVPVISIRTFPDGESCSQNFGQNLTLLISAILSEGGMLLGRNTILAEFHPQWRNHTNVNRLVFNSDVNGVLQTEGILVCKGRTDLFASKYNLDSMASSSKVSLRCGTPDQYNDHPKAFPCVVLNRQTPVKDLLKREGSYGELRRWLAFGNKEVVTPLESKDSEIPLTAHIIWRRNGALGLLDYLSVLSAVRVGGFVVKFYSYSEPTGEYWKRLVATARVTSVLINASDFGHRDTTPHPGDILCVDSVVRDGGVCQTTRVLWRSPLPTALRRYELITGEANDLPDVTVIFGQPRARFLRILIPNLRLYEGENWTGDSVRTVHRLFRQFPYLVHTSDTLYAGCSATGCSPNPFDPSALFVKVLPTAEKFFESRESLKALGGPLSAVVNAVLSRE